MNNLLSVFHNQPLKQYFSDSSYLVNSLTDHVPATSPEVLRETIQRIKEAIASSVVLASKIIGEEERGGFIAVGVAMETNLSFTLAKQNPVNIPGEIGIVFPMAYNSKMTMFINGVSKGDKVIVVDDLVDSGGTLIALIKALQNAEVEVIDAVALVERVEKDGVKKILDETGVFVKTVIKLDTSGDTSIVLNAQDLSNIVV